MSNFYARLDDIETLLNEIRSEYGINPETIFGKLPIMLAEEEIHAKWDFVERRDYWIGDAAKWKIAGGPYKTVKEMPVCSNCKTEFGRIVLKHKRCPECGAHMDLEDIEERCKSYPHR